MANDTQPDIVVIGGANYDYLALARELPRAGVTVQGTSIHEAAGGKGANQAVGAARLGARVEFIGRLGLDARGDEVSAALQRERVGTSFLTRDATLQTGTALIHVDAAGRKQILAISGANDAVSVDQVRSARTALTHAKVLLLQLEIPLEATCAAAELAHECGVKVVLDPAPAIPLPDELLPKVDVVKPNANEARVITGVEVTDRASAHKAATILLRRGARAAAVTAGDSGTLLLSADDEVWLPRLPVKSVDATGAGDAFAAGLSVALAEGRPLRDAGLFANAAAALSTTIVGAQAALPSRDAVLALLNMSHPTPLAP